VICFLQEFLMLLNLSLLRSLLSQKWTHCYKNARLKIAINECISLVEDLLVNLWIVLVVLHRISFDSNLPNIFKCEPNKTLFITITFLFCAEIIRLGNSFS